MKTNLLPLWCAVIISISSMLYATAGLSGCTTSQKTVAYKTLNIIATSVDAGMRAYADAVVAGKVPDIRQAQVRDAHTRYSKAMQAAIATARFDTSAPAPESVKALASEVLTLITEALK